MRTNSLKNMVIFLIVLTLITFVFIYYSVDEKSSTNRIKQRLKLRQHRFRVGKSKVNIYDLSKKLDSNLYKSIKCRESAEFYVKTTLCLHGAEQDVVSKDIWRYGFWEEHILRVFLFYVNKHPDWLVIDIGAQIGQYTLFAAKMGSQVVSIEPFYDNVIRIHKAALMEKLTDKITLIKNSLYHKRHEIKELEEIGTNIGGQGVVEFNGKKFKKEDLTNNKYLTETILLDDIVDHLPRRKKDNRQYEKAIVKMDIEGIELLVLEHSERFFASIEVQIVFMEWGLLKSHNDASDFIHQVIDFFQTKSFLPYTVDNMVLDRKKWASWPFDIMWIKPNLI